MSPELHKYIDSLPIVSYLLSTDRQLVGRKVGEDLMFHYVNAVCSLETEFSEDDQVNQFMIPLVPHSLTETTSLSRSHVICESPVAFKLKKMYCEALLSAKVNSLTSSSSPDLDTNKPFNDPKKPYGDRWQY